MENTKPTQEEVEKEIKKYDRAFLNSTLAYAIYTKNASWFEPWAQLKSLYPNDRTRISDFIKEDSYFNPSRMYDRVFVSLMDKKFVPAELPLKEKDNHKSDTYLYEFDSQFKNGIYKSMDNFAAACAMKTRNMDGTYTLHVSFRGTDTQAKPFLKFLTKAYVDMEAHYDSFKPFEKAVLEFAKDPANKINKIEVSGHSLGGSMAQLFCKSKDVQNCGVNMEGFTYGAPGGVSKFLTKWITATYHLATKGNIKHFVNTMVDTFTNTGYDKNDKVTQYEHGGDLIPRIGKFFILYKTGSEILRLKDVASDKVMEDYLLTNGKATNLSLLDEKKSKAEKNHANFFGMMETASDKYFHKPIKFLMRMSAVVYHDMARYGINLGNKIDQLKKSTEYELPDNVAPNTKLFGALESSLRLQRRAIAASKNIQTTWGSEVELFKLTNRSAIGDIQIVQNNIQALRNKVTEADLDRTISYKKI